MPKPRNAERDNARVRRRMKTRVPVVFSEHVAEAILIALAEGESLRAICARRGMPAASSFYRWLIANADLRERYTAARAWQAEHWAEEIIAIADDCDGDWSERTDTKGKTTRVFNRDHVSRAKLRIDARRWLMACLAPKKYGARASDAEPAADGPFCDITINLDPAPEN
ncbi:MAG: terminase small subunit protein [Rhodobacteraceae bacterium]|nr:terminase small subunit protein [Paracoccaceae bacterium]